MDEKDYVEIDILKLLKALWHKAWAIVLSAVVCGGLGFSCARFVVTPLYEASTLMYVNNSSFSVGSTSFSISASELTAAQSLVDTYLVILNTRTTLNDVIEEADLPYTYEKLKKMISAEAVNSTEIFEIVVTSPDPYEAEKIANTIGKVLPDKISGIVDRSSVRIVDYAVIPSKKASPSIALYTAVGILLGLLVSCVVVALRDMFDDLIRTEDDLTQKFDLPLLAVIPDLSGTNTRSYGGYGKTKAEEGV